jgi:hypothetical protein
MVIMTYTPEPKTCREFEVDLAVSLMGDKVYAHKPSKAKLPNKGTKLSLAETDVTGQFLRCLLEYVSEPPFDGTWARDFSIMVNGEMKDFTVKVGPAKPLKETSNDLQTRP